jgi:PAS domain-containing protein
MQRTFDVRISPTVDWRGRTTSRVVVLRDSTDRKRAETALRELNATLEAQVAARTAELTQAVDRLKHVHAIGEAVARAPGLTECMQAVAQGTVERLGFDVAAFSLYDGENQAFTQLGAYPVDDRLQSALGMLGIDLSAMHWPYRRGVNPTIDRIMDGEVHVCQSLADLASPPLSRPVTEAAQRLSGLRVFLSIPLLIEEEEVVGALVATTRRPEISAEEQRAVELVAREAAGAIESARYLERLQGRTAELEAILHSTSEGIVVTDEQGEILLTNPVAKSWLGQTLSPEDADQLQEAVRELGLQAGTLRSQSRRRRGQAWSRASLRPWWPSTMSVTLRR